MAKIRITYWAGTTQCEGTATTYRGAIRIASRNRNIYGPRFYDEDGKRLYDDGNGLAYEETAEDIVARQRRYAVIG